MPSGGPGVTAGGGRAPTVSVPSRPKPPSASAFLKRDIGYQQALRQFGLNWHSFLADRARQEGAAKQQYTTQNGNLATQRTRDLADIMNDFASRGLLKSGLYAQRQGEYERDYRTTSRPFSNSMRISSVN
jgi:hypothetical protein